MPQRNPFNRPPRDVGSIYPLSPPDAPDPDHPDPLDDLFGGSTAAERLLVAVRQFLSRRRRIGEEDDPAVLLPLLDEIDILSATLRQQLQAHTTPPTE